MYDSVRSLLELVQEAVSPWHTVQAVRKRLSKADFQPLKLGEIGQLESGKSYYVEAFDSTVLAFSIGCNGYTAVASTHLTLTTKRSV